MVKVIRDGPSAAQVLTEAQQDIREISEADLQVSPVFVVNQIAFKSGKYRYIVNQGGARCFAPGTMVSTAAGPKKIEDLTPGDLVASFDGERDVFKKVTAVHKMENTKPTVRLKLKNGQTITATDDHEFYFEGGWHSLKSLLLLRDERKLATDPRV